MFIRLEDAITFLKDSGIKFKSFGVILIPDRPFTKDESQAVDYLVCEWDFAVVEK